MFYVVTFEQKMQIGCEWTWIECSRIASNLEEAKDFLEFMYDTNEANFRHAHVWTATELEHEIKTTVTFGSNEE